MASAEEQDYELSDIEKQLEEFENDFRNELSPGERKRFSPENITQKDFLEYSRRLAFYVGKRIYEDKSAQDKILSAVPAKLKSNAQI